MRPLTALALFDKCAARQIKTPAQMSIEVGDWMKIAYEPRPIAND